MEPPEDRKKQERTSTKDDELSNHEGLRKQILDDYKSGNLKVFEDPNTLQDGANYLLDELIDHAIYSIVFEQHFLNKSGAHKAIEGETKNSDELKIVRMPNHDIFGRESRKSVDLIISCPICKNSVGSSRFAPHLAKCMGMGRNSSRIASKRIARTQSRSDEMKPNYNYDDDEDDKDWQTTEKRRRKAQPSRSGTTKRNGKTT